MQPIHPVLYLNVELKARELSAKALVACAAAEAGYQVVIGQQWLIYANLAKLPPGICLFKSINRIHMNAMRIAKKAGHVVMANEEEILAHTKQDYLNQLTPPELDACCDYYLACGPLDAASLVARLPAMKDRVFEVGNARIDQLRPEFHSMNMEAIARIRQQHGRFILINGNYSLVNSQWGGIKEVFSVLVQAGDYDPNLVEDVQAFQAYWDWEQSNLKAMAEFIPKFLERFPDLNIVIRPHPGERLDPWLDVAACDQRIRVIREGSHLPWTLASEVMLHTSCTTGMESAIAGHPTINLLTAPPPTDHHLSNLINPVARTPDEAITMLALLLDRRMVMSINLDEIARLVAPYLSHFTGQMSFAASVEKIREVFQRTPHKKNAVVNPAKLIDYNQARTERQKAKFTVSLDEMQTMVASLGQTLGRFAQLDIIEIGDSLFVIKSTSSNRL